MQMDVAEPVIRHDPGRKRPLWSNACSTDLFRYRQCQCLLEKLTISAESAVCNDPGSCNHIHDMHAGVF